MMDMMDMMDMAGDSVLINEPGKDIYEQHGRGPLSSLDFLKRYGSDALPRDACVISTVARILGPRSGGLLIALRDRFYFSADDDEIINKASNLELEYIFDCGVIFCETAKAFCFDYSKVEFY
jgi:hypothetical protein